MGARTVVSEKRQGTPTGLGARRGGRHLLWGACVLLLGLAGQSWAELDIAGSRARLERILHDNILPFWYPAVLDTVDGGYRLNHDREGNYLGPADKALVTQARTLWFFARLYNAGMGGPQHLAAARHGFEFMRRALWDAEHGGFYWSVSPDGSRPVQALKHLYGQGFGLYALVEYGRASGDRRAEQMAQELFGLLEFHAHDRQHGGYREFFGRDWGAVPAGATGYVGGGGPGLKLMNTHLHLMEPFTTYYQWLPQPRLRQRLVELVFVQSNAVVRQGLGACTDRYAADWTPLLDGDAARVSYGHDIENVWLLMAAQRALGLSDGPLTGLYRSLMAYSLEYGYDGEAGGFYDSGPFNAAADRRDKVWWVQAEGLVAALYMYRLTGEARYAEVFGQTLDWIEAHQIDGRGGDWFSVVQQGQGQGNKAGAWKSPYHNGRAMIECLETLDDLEMNGLGNERPRK